MKKIITVVLGLAPLAFLDCSAATLSTLGDCSSNFEEIKDNAKINYHCILNKNSEAFSTYLIATHPTKISLENIKFTQFIEDRGEDFLTLEIKNLSEIPAYTLTTQVLDQRSATTYNKLKQFKITKSNTYKAAGVDGFTILANTTTSFPTVSVVDLITKVQPHIDHHTFCVYDASIPSNMDVPALPLLDPHQTAPSLNSVQESQTYNHIERSDILFKIKYTTIFKETNIIFQRAWIFYATRASSGLVWYPSKRKYDRLRCLD